MEQNETDKIPKTRKKNEIFLYDCRHLFIQLLLIMNINYGQSIYLFYTLLKIMEDRLEIYVDSKGRIIIIHYDYSI